MRKSASVRKMQDEWNSFEGKIDPEIFRHVRNMLKIQAKEAIWWRNACLLYFQSISKRPIPADLLKKEVLNQSKEKSRP